MRKRNSIILGIVLVLLPSVNLSAEEFKRAVPGKVFSFPRDHYSHPEFKTEWWYYSGHLKSPNGKEFYGFQLTFFRTGLTTWETKNQKSKWAIRDLFFAHLAITDESANKFDYREKISRGSLGEAGALVYTKNGEPFRVWIEDWSVELKNPGMRDHLLKGGNTDLGIELLLTPQRNPVIHGQNGISKKAEGEGYASHYYSITRMQTEGKIFLKGKQIPVQGMSWMDHEFGSNQLREYQVGWDWFSIQLEDGTDLMFYQLRHKDAGIGPYSSGTMILPDDTSQHLPSKEFRIDILEKWKSKESGATYPSRWSVKVPGQQVELILTPTVKDQELMTQASTRVTYWEGSVKVEGKARGQPIKGQGYVEMTGYAKPFTEGI